MRSSRLFRALCATLMSVTCFGVIPGCNTGVEEIPLAKVPPPPENFSRVQAKASHPKSASPNNANEMRR
jgi:hypothetical protein